MKIAFFDIDGTLTSEKNGTVPESVYESIYIARSNGNKMFLCSGRCRCHIGQPFIDLNMDGMICGCGTQIILNESGEIFHHVLPEDEIDILHDIANRLKIDILYESSDRIGFDPYSSFRTQKSQKLVGVLNNDFGKIFYDPEENGFSCDKACAFTVNSRQAEEMHKSVSAFMTSIDRGDGLYELVPRGLSKATGVQMVLEHEHLSKQYAYAFGDSTNDIEMLQFVDHAVVMGNAYPEQLKKYAEYVAPKASENGISIALEHFGFLDPYQI